MCSGTLLFSNEAPAAAHVILASGSVTGRQQAARSFRSTALLFSRPELVKAEPDFIPLILSRLPHLHWWQNFLCMGRPNVLIFSNPENGPSLLISSVSTGSPQAQLVQGASPAPRAAQQEKSLDLNPVSVA